MMRVISFLGTLLVLLSSAFAQSGAPVKQSGNITPNTVPWWITSGVIGGGVTAVDSPISSFGATGPICSNSARQASGAWNSLCFQANANSAATISLQNYGTATPQSVQICVNGACTTPSGAIPFVINPPSGTTTKGLVIAQTLPAVGSVIGPVLLNSITVINPGLSTTASGLDDFGQLNSEINALRINYATTGSNTTNNGALGVAHFVTAAAESYAGALGTTINANATGHNTWGIIGYSTVWPAGSISTLVGIDAEVGIATGGSSLYRIAVGANSQGPVQGSTLDAAFAVSTLPSSPLPGGGVPVGWQHVIALSTGIYGSGGAAPPISSTGDFFFSETPLTIGHFANLSNLTIQGYIMKFANLLIPGHIPGFVLPPPSHVGAFQYGVQNAAGSTIENDAFTGPARFIGLRANTSSVAPSAVQIGQTITGLTAIAFDGGNYVENTAIGFFAAQNYTPGNTGSYAAIFTNALNTTGELEVARFQQGFMVGTTTDPGSGKIDAANGYKSGGTSGVSCTVTTPAHITVVNGIVTLCN